MDTPDRPRAGAAAGFEDSPVFNFINNLSPIPPPKPQDSSHNGPIDSSANRSNSTSKLPQTIQFVGDSSECDKNQNADGKKDLARDQESIELEGGSYINNVAHDPHLYWDGPVEGPTTDYTPQLLPGACQSQSVSNDQICNAVEEPSDHMPTDQSSLSQNMRMRRRCLFNEKAGAVNKAAKKTSDRHSANTTTPRCKTNSGDKPVRTPPCALPGIGLHLNALAPISTDKIVSQAAQSSISQASNFPCAVSSSSTSEPNIVNEDSSQAIVVANADESGQGSPKKKRYNVYARHFMSPAPFCWTNHGNAILLCRHKFDDGDGTSCKRCSCKKSKCLKLYCECFHAGVFCSEPCSCQDCLNKPSNMEIVLSTRKQIESRNPLAFAPKVIRTSEPGQELGEYSNRTPASARHKRGCNCKKSSCLKSTCNAIRVAGCSISCRCEGCKNAFGRREGLGPLNIEEAKQGHEENSACVKEEKKEDGNNQLVICPAANPAPAENVLTTPSAMDIRPLASLPPSSSKRPRSTKKALGHPSRLCNSQAPLKTDTLLSPFENYAEIMFGVGTSDSLKGGLSPQTSVKVVSPNKKRLLEFIKHLSLRSFHKFLVGPPDGQCLVAPSGPSALRV
ncbi:hypothetical protein ZWY2020_014147 [Hordeum vulgare]|nr:hypothetical protein ZWY2020_014147 [Hordeum vulgare]